MARVMMQRSLQPSLALRSFSRALAYSASPPGMALPFEPPQEVVRLNRLENIVEQHGRSLASFASQLEEQKELFATMLRDIELLKSDPGSKVQHLSPPSLAESVLHSLDVPASSSTCLCAPPWPEWTSFLQHLKGLPFFKDLGVAAEFGGLTTFDDPTTVKRTLAKFSQAYEHIFDSLSVTHLRVLAEHGCPNDDRRTLASGNRLRNHFQIESKSNSCDSKPANPKLSDVMRLIYTFAEVARKDGISDKNKLSILHLLEEIINITSHRKQHKIVDPETLKDSGSVLQKSRREKTRMVEAKTGLEGSISPCDAEMVSQHDKWKCPSCSCMNRQSKRECMECSFQRIETSASNIDSMMQKSSMLSTNKSDPEVYVSGEKTKEKIVSASKKSMEMPVQDNARQAAEGLVEQGLENVSKRFSEVQGLQKCTLSEEDEKNLGRAGLIDVSDVEEHSDIFDDIFDSDDTNSSKSENTSMKCSLSDLVRQNQKAFSSSKRERGVATGADDYEQRGLRSGKGYKPDDLDISTSYRAERDHSIMDAEDKGMLPHRSGRGQAGAGLSMGIKDNQSYNYNAGIGGKGSSGRNFGEERPRSKGRHSNAEAEAGGRYSSGKIYGNEGPRYQERKARGRYSDESEGCGLKTERGGEFQRQERNEVTSRSSYNSL